MVRALPSPRTILVTGATGFIGRHLVRRLAAEPAFDVITLTRSGTPTAPGVRAIAGDVAAPPPLEVVDAVIHLAAFIPKAAGQDVANVREVIRTNVVGTEALLAALPEPPRRVVFASTVDLYAASNAPMTESAPLAPATPYSASKLMGEAIVRALPAEAVILRYGHIFGPGEEAYAKLIPHTIRELLRGRPARIAGDGGALRDLLYVEDAVEATVRALDAQDAAGDPINIVRGESYTVRNVVDTLVDITQSLAPTRVEPARGPARSLRFDASRMAEVLGTWPLVDLREGLRQEVSAMHGRPVRLGRHAARQP
jgi:nucleoside-diphosphate-sugar epimerase